jgi:hypothetical protein
VVVAGLGGAGLEFAQMGASRGGGPC